MPKTRPERTVVGWREWVSIPTCEVEWIKAKLDTGARTSAIHAHRLQVVDGVDGPVARFEIHPWQRSADAVRPCELPVIDHRSVRSSTGHADHRPVVMMELVIAGVSVPAEVTLTRRDEMGFRMLIGREALRRRFLVDAGRSYVGGRPPSEVRRRNRGRGGAAG